ncbi:zinc finger MYM-type protein 1-like [Arctopsyche grandis]|uniref:zinc finger MYM-type protein 1-like n=1 Tax=Arctopsyche grandis TaxID=121162 RepID=UPI00406D9AC9
MANSVQDILTIPFSNRSFEIKLKIIKDGKPCPSLPNLSSLHKEKTKVYTRHFCVSNYKKFEWITGCEIRSKLFCWPCLLFSKDINVWNKEGFADLNHLTAALKKHEGSQAHVQSFLSIQMFGKQRIDVLIDSQRKAEISRHNEQVNKNRDVLKRIINAIIYLGKQELSLRGHDESCNSVNKGNYIEYLNALREYDSVLDTHLNTATTFRGTSPSIQNDIIEAISHVIKVHIKNEVESASFVAIILDETSDIMTKSQLSTVLRFVCKGNVHERFISFTDVSADKTSNGLF